MNRYEIQLLDSVGAPLLSLARSPPWFESWSGYDPRIPFQAPPRPTLTELQEDSQDRLWVGIAVADRNWAPVEQQGEQLVGTVSMADIQDTVLEVIDWRDGQLLASARVDAEVVGFLNNQPLVYVRREAANGEILIDVWRLSLQSTKVQDTK